MTMGTMGGQCVTQGRAGLSHPPLKAEFLSKPERVGHINSF